MMLLIMVSCFEGLDVLLDIILFVTFVSILALIIKCSRKNLLIVPQSQVLMC